MLKRLSYLLLSLLFIIILGFPNSTFAENNTVYVIPVQGTIDGGQAAFFKRAYNEAVENNATHILLEIDTPGGRIDSAVEMGKIIRNADIHTIAFVEGGAISAGALITISATDVFMAPGSTIGAAEPRMGDQPADEKTLSYWTKQLESAAEATGRDPKVAAAMSDAAIQIPGVVEAGKLLTLTANEAVQLKMADDIFTSREEVLSNLNLENAKIVVTEPGLAENIASLVTNPYISPILLTIGFYGLLMEVYSAGWGVPGTMGLISLALFFGGHLIAGFAGIEAVLLFALGVILLGFEVFVTPGFGVAGIGGLAALIASIFVASISTHQAIISLIVVFLGTIILFLLTFRLVTAGRLWRNLILGDKLNAEGGYSSANVNLVNYLGREGTTVTPLRPSGTVEFDDGERLDVVTEGGFISSQTRVKIIKVEGVRVLVRQLKN